MNDKGIKPILFILAIVAFFIGMDSLVVSPLIPDIAKSTATPMEKGEWLITSYALFYGLTAPFSRSKGTGGAFKVEKPLYDLHVIKPTDYYYSPEHLLEKMLEDQGKGVQKSVEYVLALRGKYCR
nr:hypothetical protein [Bacillus pseudomycoides]